MTEGADALAIQPLLMGPSLDEAIAEARQIVADAKARYPHIATVALFSGGNDSTTMLHLCGDLFDFALHINTGIGIEDTREFVRDTCAGWGMSLIEKRTDPAWYRNAVVSRGFPGPQAHRYMYINLKERRLEQLHRELRTKRGQKVLLLSGVRASESERRMGHAEAIHARKGFVWVNPLHGWIDWHMWQYRCARSIPRNPVADRVHKSGECLCGAYAKPDELTDLEIWYPGVAAEIHSLERQARLAGHRTRAVWGWGADSRARYPAPGPMCSACQPALIDTLELPA